MAAPSILDDVDMGSVQYGDPFPEGWTRYFEICQQVSIEVPAPDGTGNKQKWLLSNGATTALPAAPVMPLIGPVESPTINDQDIFSATTVSGQSYTLKWGKPSLGVPTAYIVKVITDIQWDSRQYYGPVATLYTAKTTLTIPPGVLMQGKKYIFLITVLSDGRANLETSPRRSALPIANADVISAPITIGAQ
jgi:hypothetical protein